MDISEYLELKRVCDSKNYSSDDPPSESTRLYTMDDILTAERSNKDSMTCDAYSPTHIDSNSEKSWSLASGSL